MKKIIFILLICLLFSFEAFAKQGCCSWHGGVCGCDKYTGKQICCDKTLSKSCYCGE